MTCTTRFPPKILVLGLLCLISASLVGWFVFSTNSPRRLSIQLREAADAGDLKRAEALLSRGADPNLVFSRPLEMGYFVGALHIAVYKGDEPMINLLLDRGADVDLRDSTGRTALMLAMKRSDLRFAELLISRGADVNARRTNAQADTVLAEAVMLTNAGGADLLLRHGANVDAEIHEGRTALFPACGAHYGRVETVRVLLRHGADPRHRTPRGLTARDVAASRNDQIGAEIIELLDAALSNQ